MNKNETPIRPGTNEHDVANTMASLKNEVELAKIELERFKHATKVRPWVFAGFLAACATAITIAYLMKI
jgi:hypothetical protein